MKMFECSRITCVPSSLFHLTGILAILLASGCPHKPDVQLIKQAQDGDYGKARAYLSEKLKTDPDLQDKSSRSYTLGRMELALAELADGMPASAQLSSDEVWSILRTQGLNKDKAVEEVVVQEDVRRWKGEPFEQAMMCCYRAIQQAMLGRWDEAKGAADESLFLLKDFGEEMQTEGAKRRERSNQWLTGQLFGTPGSSPEVKTVQVGESTFLGSCIANKSFFEQMHSTFEVKLLPDDIVNDQEVYVIQASSSSETTNNTATPVAEWSGNETMNQLPQHLRPVAKETAQHWARYYYFSKESGVLVRDVETMEVVSVIPSLYGVRGGRFLTQHEQIRDYSNVQTNVAVSRQGFEEGKVGSNGMMEAYRNALKAMSVNRSDPTSDLAAVEKTLIELGSKVKSVRADIWQETNTATQIQKQRNITTTGFDGTIEQLVKDDKLLTRLELNLSVSSALAKEKKKKKAELNTGYATVKTNFALGYLLRGAAAAISNEDDEARDDLAQVVAISPRLKPLADQIGARKYNTLLVVDFGFGPRKTAYGPDNALVTYFPAQVCYHGPARLAVNVKSGNGKLLEEQATMVCDLSRMAADHRWTNLEDVRIAKSRVGDFFVKCGRRSGDAYAQLFYLVIGAGLKAGAHADTRQCEITSSRVYMTPLTILSPGTTLEISIPGVKSPPCMVLCGLNPPDRSQPVQMLYVRITPSNKTPEWAVADKVLYSNDSYEERTLGDDLPYILGGRCVCRPSEKALTKYQAAGNLKDMSLAELQDLYRAEGIKLSLQEEGGRAGLHVLEGGNSLECPVTGSAGFKRLFCQKHEDYKPKSPRVRELMAQYQKNVTSQPAVQASSR